MSTRGVTSPVRVRVGPDKGLLPGRAGERPSRGEPYPKDGPLEPTPERLYVEVHVPSARDLTEHALQALPRPALGGLVLLALEVADALAIDPPGAHATRIGGLPL